MFRKYGLFDEWEMLRSIGACRAEKLRNAGVCKVGKAADGRGTQGGKATKCQSMTESGKRKKGVVMAGENETKPEERFFGIQLIGAGRQDCSDMHSYGPGMRSCYIIHYIIKGSGTFIVNRRSYPVKKGESFLITPYTTVHYYPDAESPWEYTWIEFTGGRTADFLREMGIPMNLPVFPEIPEDRILGYFEKAVQCTHDWERRKEAAGLATAIMGCIGDRNRNSDADISEKGERFGIAVAYIEANYRYADFNILRLSRMMNLGRTTLYRAFRENSGMSPVEYLSRYRMEQARKMLQNQASVKAAALSCGFSDPLYFSRQFRRITGGTPSGIRNPS